jgi:hypothetical protein
MTTCIIHDKYLTFTTSTGFNFLQAIMLFVIYRHSRLKLYIIYQGLLWQWPDDNRFKTVKNFKILPPCLRMRSASVTSKMWSYVSDGTKYA